MAEPTTTIDWPTLLGDLQYLLGEPDDANPNVRNPVGTPSLAKHLGMPRSTVVGYLEGTEPRHSEGERLLRIWSSLSGKAIGFAPVARPVLAASKTRDASGHAAEVCVSQVSLADLQAVTAGWVQGAARR